MYPQLKVNTITSQVKTGKKKRKKEKKKKRKKEKKNLLTTNEQTQNLFYLYFIYRRCSESPLLLTVDRAAT